MFRKYHNHNLEYWIYLLSKKPFLIFNYKFLIDKKTHLNLHTQFQLPSS